MLWCWSYKILNNTDCPALRCAFCLESTEEYLYLFHSLPPYSCSFDMVVIGSCFAFFYFLLLGDQLLIMK